MALVNDDYAIGEGDITNYLEQISTLTDNQLSLLSTLKEVSKAAEMSRLMLLESFFLRLL